MKGNFKRLVGVALTVVMLLSMSVVGYCEDGMSDARSIRVNGSVTDNIAESNENDYYSFELDEAGYITIDFKHENFTENERSWAIVLYDDSSNEIYSFDSYQNKPKTSSCSIGLPEGLYYILVKRASYGDHHDGDYTLSLNFDESENWESELNETFKDADRIKTNSFYNGTIRTSDDKDYYKFSLENDGVINIAFEHENFTENERSWEITLYDDSSNELYTLSSYQNETKANSCNIGLTQGDYFVYIHRASYGDLHQGDYKFKVEYNKDNNWEKEANDTIKEATRISTEVDYKGSVKTSEDKDYYRVDINEPGYYVVDFIHENLTDDERSWSITLYNDTSNELGNTYSAQNQVKARVRTDYLEAGTYYVLVARNSYNDLSEADYTLKVAKANQKTITMQINNPRFTNQGKTLNIDEGGTVPVVIDGRTLVPIRAIIEGMGGKVDWDGNTQKVTLTYYSDKMELTLGKTRAYLNGSSKTLDVAPRTINDRTMLPIRFISENFGCDVEWDGNTQTVTIKY